MNNLDALTRREHQVLVFLGAGLTFEQIALTLNVACKTIRFYAQNAYPKIGVFGPRARTLAAVWAWRNLIQRGTHDPTF